MKKWYFKNGLNYLMEFEAHLKEHDKSLRTIETYLENTCDFLHYVSESDSSILDINDITTIDVIEYRNYCKDRKNSVSTINLKISSINAYFNFLVEKKIVSKNPVLQVKKVKVDHKISYHQKTFDEKTFKALRRLYYKEANPLHICIFELLSKTGIRASELCELKMENLDSQVLDPSARSGKIGFIGKGYKYREIPLHPDVRAAIRDWISYRRIRKLESEYLLLSERRAKFSTGGLRAIIRKYHGQIPGCKEYSIHAYRHYFAISLLRGTPPVDIMILSKLLGHSSITSSQIYTQASYRDLENAIDNLTNNL